MSDMQRIWFLVGAGISAASPSNIPLWGEVARDTMQFLYRTLEYKIGGIGGTGHLLAKEALDCIADEVYPETVLESMTRAYGRSNVTGQLNSIVDPPDCAPNACHHAIARLCKQGQVGGIVTTNFDTLLERALDQEMVPYRVITTAGMIEQDVLPLIKIHGTIAEASSLVFTRNEYYLGLADGMRDILRSALVGSILVIAGYSGNDIDVFPLIRSMIEDGSFAKVQVVDRAPLHDNNRFEPLRHCIEYHHAPAEKFLCELAGTSHISEIKPRKRRVSAIAPNEDKYPAALFFGDCLLALGLNNQLAFNLFFLTQDIVEEETGDLRQLCITLLAKSHALFDMGDNSWAESEYSQGRTLLHRILEDSDLPNHGVILSEFGSSLASLETEGDVSRRYSTSGFLGGHLMPDGPDCFDTAPRSLDLLHSILGWELRTRIRVCFSALAVSASLPVESQQRRDMLAIPEKLMYGFRRWQDYFAASRTTDELPFLPLFYSEYFAAYRSLLMNEVAATERLDRCAQLGRKRGYYIGMSQCYFLKEEQGIRLTKSERSDYAAIRDYCGVDEKTMIAPLFRPGRDAFNLSINRYSPPKEGWRNASL